MIHPTPWSIIQCYPLSGYPLHGLPPGRARLRFAENRKFMIQLICSISFSMRQCGWIKT